MNLHHHVDAPVPVVVRLGSATGHHGVVQALDGAIRNLEIALPGLVLIEVQGLGLELGIVIGGLQGIAVAGFVFPDYDAADDGQRFVMFPDDEDRLAKTQATFVFNWFDELERTLPSGK